VPDTASSPAAMVIRMRVSLIRCSFQQGLDPPRHLLRRRDLKIG
jgi:hypothetical protein